jgi:hypothetical protein
LRPTWPHTPRPRHPSAASAAGNRTIGRSRPVGPEGTSVASGTFVPSFPFAHRRRRICRPAGASSPRAMGTPHLTERATILPGLRPYDECVRPGAAAKSGPACGMIRFGGISGCDRHLTSHVAAHSAATAPKTHFVDGLPEKPCGFLFRRPGGFQYIYACASVGISRFQQGVSSGSGEQETAGERTTRIRKSRLELKALSLSWSPVLPLACSKQCANLVAHCLDACEIVA